LGVRIDDNLNWKDHTHQISLKVSKSLGILTRVKNVFHTDVLRTLYFTLIQPYFYYCTILWGGASKFALSRLIVLQKRALRIITHSNYRAHTFPLFLQTNILPLSHIHTFQLSIFMYKSGYNILPLSCVYTIKSKNCRFNFRKKRNFVDSYFHTNMRKNHVAIAGPWNSLPEYIRTSCSFSIFRCRILTYLGYYFIILVSKIIRSLKYLLLYNAFFKNWISTS